VPGRTSLPVAVSHNEAVPRDLADVAWPVSTARLSLRRARPEDAEAVLSYRRLPHVVEWLGDPPDDFHSRFAEPERLDVLLVIERSGAVIGDVMVKVGDAWAPARVVDEARGAQAELGWSLRPEETGKGHATEAVEAALRICFEVMGLRRVTASCFAANAPSYRVMERLGMRREAHTVADALHPSGEWMDGYSYALLAEEWRRRRP
jgi:RimJ/RimL family protein N-acetyltransferase